jgi:hypothetical protein
MNCVEVRRLVDADPAASATGALAEHLRGCEACRRWQHEMRGLESALRRAFDIDLHPAAAASVAAAAPAAMRTAPRRSASRLSRLRPWALAAGLLLALTAGTLAWIVQPTAALAGEVVAHAEGEPASWSSVVPVPDAEVDAILQRAGVVLDASAEDVVYASTCPFRGHEIPHLVVRTANGPVTVLVLRHERVTLRHRFSEDGYTGVLVPSGSGSIAVLAQGSAQVDEAAALVTRALRWDSD